MQKWDPDLPWQHRSCYSHFLSTVFLTQHFAWPTPPTHTHTKTPMCTHTQCRDIDLPCTVVEQPCLVEPLGWDTQSAADVLLLNCPRAPFRSPADLCYWFQPPPALPSSPPLGISSTSFRSSVTPGLWLLSAFSTDFLLSCLFPRGGAMIYRGQASLLPPALSFPPFLRRKKICLDEDWGKEAHYNRQHLLRRRRRRCK